MKSQLKLGFMPTKRRFFSGEDAGKYKDMILKKIAELAPNISIVDLEGINGTGLLNTLDDAARTIERFTAEKVDAIFTPHCNFGCEEAVCIAAKKMSLRRFVKKYAQIPSLTRLVGKSKILSRMYSSSRKPYA